MYDQERGSQARQDVIKVALVGCGSRGTGALTQTLRTRGPIKLWAMADLFGDRLDASLASLVKGEAAAYDREAHAGFGSQLDVPPERRFVGFDAYQKAIDSGVDLVILATPPQFRPLHFEYAVKRKKHLFIEKPVAVDAPGVRRILAANEEAKRQGLKIGVGLMSRHNQCDQETVKRLQDGAIGPVMLMRCYWNTGYLRDTPPRSADMTEMAYQLRNPYHFLWLGGDYLVDALIHNIDLALWIKGAYPVSAQGQGGRLVYLPNQHGDIYDHQCVEYTFADGSWMFAQSRQLAGCWNTSAVHVHGPLGEAEVARGRIRGTSEWRFRGRVANPYQAELDVLLDAIRENQPHNEVDYGAMSTMTAIMGRMASYSGQVVGWQEALQSQVSLSPDRYAFDATPPVVADRNGVYPVAIPGVTKAF
jgi:predicted dehydrogenase